MSAASVRMSMPSAAALSRSMSTSIRGLSIFRSLSRKMKRLLAIAFCRIWSARSASWLSSPTPPMMNSPPPSPPALGSEGGTIAKVLRPLTWLIFGCSSCCSTALVDRLRSLHGFSTKPAIAIGLAPPPLPPKPPLNRK